MVKNYSITFNGVLSLNLEIRKSPTIFDLLNSFSWPPEHICWGPSVSKSLEYSSSLLREFKLHHITGRAQRVATRSITDSPYRSCSSFQRSIVVLNSKVTIVSCLHLI